MIDYTHSKLESEETGKPFVYGVMTKRMNQFSRKALFKIAVRHGHIDSIYQEGRYLTDPSNIINRVFANQPFWVDRTFDTEFYLGKEYPMYFDRIGTGSPAELVRRTYDYLLNMDKSRFHPIFKRRSEIILTLQGQRSE